MIFDSRRCELGEGPLWHPLRNQLFWFDILGQRLLTVEAGTPREWSFAGKVSAAGWVDRDRLVVAGESGLLLFDIDSGSARPLVDLEAANPLTRSNDGRADPCGGFWIGTMGKKAERQAGALYRFHRGELRRLFAGLTIPNAICFAPGGQSAHFADTATGKVMRVALDAAGWPTGQPEVFLDLGPQGLNPDGAVIDAQGLMWLAQWGAARVAAYAPDGSLVRHVGFNAPHTSCPAFGGPGLTTLFCTTALEGMDGAARAAHPQAGMTMMAEKIAEGQPEHPVLV